MTAYGHRLWGRFRIAWWPSPVRWRAVRLPRWLMAIWPLPRGLPILYCGPRIEHGWWIFQILRWDICWKAAAE